MRPISLKFDEAYRISENKLKKYAAENNLFNVLEHPNIIDEPNKQQLEKIHVLNEFYIYLQASQITGEREQRLC
jgi:hypothetical protein